MQPIIYDVAVSADGFIAGPNSDVSAFPHSGQIVEDYLARLASYTTVLMGRATYEFGLSQGLPLGANPYPQMRAIVVSSSLSLPGTDVEVWRDLSSLDALRTTAPGPIYLCGGGRLASTVAASGHLTHLSLKRAPVVLGSGVPLFSDTVPQGAMTLMSQTDYGGGLLFQAFSFAEADRARATSS
ncbi:dihydrofolate reductase family protein [Gymnodinialimonas sp.]